MPQIPKKGLPERAHICLTCLANIPCLPAFQSIDIAHQNMKRGRLFINKGAVENSQINRSPFSYLQNPESERSR